MFLINKSIMLFMLLTGSILSVYSQQPIKELNDHLKPLAPFINKTWKGTFVNSTILYEF